MTKINRVLQNIVPIDHDAVRETEKRLNSLTKPKESLGYLEEFAKQLAGIKRTAQFDLTKKAIVVMAADHGVVEEGVSAYPQEVTSQMVYNFMAGGAAINVLARQVGAKIILVDMGVATEIKSSPHLVNLKIDYGTSNMTKGPAMTYEQAVLSIENGITVVEDYASNFGIDILGTGDMGIGNTTASSAIVAAFTGLPIESVTGRGTGIDDQTLKRKIKTISKALERNKPAINDPVDVLAKVGGFEIGGMAGCILAAAKLRIPVVIDGFISCTAALLAYRLQPLVKDYVFVGHQSVEMGQTAVLNELNKKPILDLNMRLGEGTGAALAIGLLEASTRIFNEMATFEEACVSEAVSESKVES